MIAEPTVTQILHEIEAANAEFVAAFNRGDAAAIAGFYTNSAKLLPPNSDFITGRDGLEGFWHAVLSSGVQGATLRSVEVEQCGETAIEVGIYTMLGAGGVELDVGKYVVIWKQEDGKWKLHRDMFSSNRPVPS